MKLQIDFNKELLNRHPDDHKEKPIHLSKRHKRYENELEKRPLKKWKKIEEKLENHNNSLKTTNNNANSYSTESHQQEQGSGYNDGAMSLKNKDNNNAITPDPMKRLNNITDNRVLRKRKRKAYTEATQKLVRDLLTWKQ